MNKIKIKNLQKKIKINQTKLKNLARLILNRKGIEQSELSVLLVDDAGIRDLNKKYLNTDRPTDVLAFRMQEGDFKDLNPQLLGDVVISLETATHRAIKLKTSFEYELHLYLAHGLLHLLGYTDTTKKGAQRMQRMQKEILR